MKYFKNLKSDIKGSGLVTVMVAVMFLSVLGSMLLMTSLTDFEMKVSERKGKESFYNAEAVLNEVRSSFQDVVSDSISSSFKVALINYGQANTQKQFAAQIEDLIGNWQLTEGNEKYSVVSEKPVKANMSTPVKNSEGVYTGSATGKYDIKTIARLLNNVDEGTVTINTKGNEDETVTVNNINIEYSTTSKYNPVIVYEYVDDKADERADDYVFTADDLDDYILDRAVFKNISITCTINNITSSISSDLVVNVPDIDISISSGGINDVTQYACIIGGTLEQKGSNSSNVSVLGSAFMNKIDVNGDSSLSFGSYTETIPATITVAEDINVLDSQLNTDRVSFYPSTTLYAGSINVNNSSSVLLASEKTYIQNDLNLMGYGAKATLEGDYYGFGDSTTDASKSSSIYANALNTELNMDNLTSLKLAGVSFVGYGTSSINSRNSTRGVASNTNQVMGESLSVKENQRIYLVDSSDLIYIKKTGSDGDVSKTSNKISSNPTCFDNVNSVLPVYYSSTDPKAADKAANSLYSSTEGFTFTSNKDWDIYDNDGEQMKKSDGDNIRWTYTDYSAEIKPFVVASNGGTQYFTYYALCFNDDTGLSDSGVSASDKKAQRGLGKLTAQENADLYFWDYSHNNSEELVDNNEKYLAVSEENLDIIYEGLGCLAYIRNIEVKLTGKTTQELAVLQSSYDSINSDESVTERGRIQELFNVLKKYVVESEDTDSFTGEYDTNNLPASDYPSSSDSRFSPYYYWIKYHTISELDNFDSSYDDKTHKVKYFYELDDNGKISSSKKILAIIAQGDYTFDKSGDFANVGLIVCNGDLTLKSDFEGMIFCKGDLIIEPTSNYNIVIKNDESLIKKCYQTKCKDGDNEKDLDDFFNQHLYELFDYNTLNSATGSASYVSQLVTYENWRKF